MNTTAYLEKLLELVLHYGPKILGALLIWFVGKWLIKMLVKGLTKLLERQRKDPSLRPFLLNLIGIVLKALLIISVLGMLGVEMTSFIALLGAIGLAVGMALSGTLQNFAGGVVLLFFKPFKIGDYIKAQGHEGIVKEIQLFHTVLKTLDNVTIIIANGVLSNSTITNLTAEPIRRVDWSFGVSYGTAVETVRQCVASLCEADTRILKDPDYYIAIEALADSAVNFTVRAYVQHQHYWEVYFDMNTAVYDAFNAQGIGIPFPQLDVHVQPTATPKEG